MANLYSYYIIILFFLFHYLCPASLVSFATAPARGIIDGKAIDQGVAYALMLVALLVTYILH
ncbi:unnamed protein product [Musa hybrid cultivar]